MNLIVSLYGMHLEHVTIRMMAPKVDLDTSVFHTVDTISTLPLELPHQVWFEGKNKSGRADDDKNSSNNK